MERPSLLSRIVGPRPENGEGAAAVEPRPRRRAVPPPSHLRRERRALLREREERIRDLGGLVLEMYRRDSFREDLLVEQCAELLQLEARLHELDALLSGRLGIGRAVASRCVCGAPLLWGSHFCANCGRPAGELAVLACATCGHALPADANFCAVCGALVARDEAANEEPAADAS